MARVDFVDRIVLGLLRNAYRLFSYMGWRGVALPTASDVSVKDIIIPLKGRALAAKVFEPSGGSNMALSKKPVLLYFHGGGMCVGSIFNTHSSCLLMYASQLQCTVLAVEYRLAPEHPFPAGIDDCIEATKWMYEEVQKDASQLVKCNGKVIIGGDSAGGLISIVVGCAVPNLSGAIIFCPVTHYDTGEYQSRKDSGGLNRALPTTAMHTFCRILFGMDATDFAEEHKDNIDTLQKAFPLMTPDATIQANMPPTFLVTAGYDILRDEGAAFASKLDKLGVKNEYNCYAKEDHGFMCTDGVGTSYNDCMAKLKAWFDSQ